MNPFFQKGQTVLFQGDSVTDCGRDREDPSSLALGYPKKVAQIYQNLFKDNEITFINKGISGNRTSDLLARYDEDFKDIQPDFVSILIGINDVWRKYDRNDPTSPETFKSNYTKLLSDIKEDMPLAKIMLIEPFVLHSLPERATWHEDLDPKIQIVRELAREFADYYLPMDGIFANLCTHNYTPHELALDGVHPTDLGHSVIAYEYLKLLGII
ncbi:MAG: SGNH/GDSL hydrolase family protein [Cellulosilyticaceae bacterium]